jgi:hypothetical protein
MEDRRAEAERRGINLPGLHVTGANLPLDGSNTAK